MNVGDFSDQAACLQREWETGQRWAGIRRDHRAEDVIRRRASIAGDHAQVRRDARRLWELLSRADAVQALDTITGPPARPNIADAQAGLSREPDAFTLVQAMIEAGTAGLYFEDRLPGPAGHRRSGEKVLIPTGEHIKTLSAARLAADVLDVPALVMARTCAHQASLLTSDRDERDHEFLTGGRTADGFHLVQPGLYARVTRALAFAPYADVLWLETSAPSLAEARSFADIIYSQHPGKLLAYSCAPTFDWTAADEASVTRFQRELAAMGYRFQLTTTPARSQTAPAQLAVSAA
jgi:isocitrate lyase